MDERDLYMYKISEEDSQDEEVLNSLRQPSLPSNHTHTLTQPQPQPLRPKPIPPVKPAFLRKQTPTNINHNSGSTTIPPPTSDLTSTKITTTIPTTITSEPPLPVVVPAPVPINYAGERSSSDGDDSGEVSPDPSTHRIESDRDGEEEEEDWTEEEEDLSCSSCDDEDVRGSGVGESDGSYSSTDHPDSDSSDLDFDSESEHHFEEQVNALISEAEIRAWGRGDGNILVREFHPSTNNGSETRNSSNGRLKAGNNTSHSQNLDNQGAVHVSPITEKSKPHKGKISRLLKRRSKPKSAQSEPTVQTEKADDRKAPEDGTSKRIGNKVFRFKDEHEGEIRRVELTIVSQSKHNLGRRATMVESLLGILPSRFSSTTQTCDTDDNRIMVSGFIPGRPAAQNKHIKIGDWLQQVNGKPVDFFNVNSVLHQMLEEQVPDSLEKTPLKITLDLQRVSGYTVTDPPTKTVTFGEEVREAGSGGGRLSDPQEIPSQIALIYISVVHTSVAPKEKTKDVIFAWPKESKSRKVKILAASHGMFSTLYKLLKDISGSHPVSSRVVIEEEEMDVVFSSDDEGNGLLLLATSSALSNFNICHPTTTQPSKKHKKLRWKDPLPGGLAISQRLMSRVENLLHFHFGSFSRAFRDTPDEKLCQFFTNAMVGLSDISEDFLYPQMPDFFLRIPLRIRSWMYERLYSFEASDSFDLVDRDVNDLEAPLFHCLGSCLLYKGMVICSTMDRELACDFHGWWRTQLGLWGLKRNTLPFQWSPLKRLILWQETFLSTDDIAQLANQDDAKIISSPLMPCYSGLIGIGDYMLGMVLQPATLRKWEPQVEMGWIKGGLGLVLRILESEVHTALEKWVLSQENEFVELYSPPGLPPNKTFLTSGTQSHSVSPSLTSKGPSSGILKNTDTPTTSSLQELKFNDTPSTSTNTSIITAQEDYSYHHGLSSTATETDRLDLNFCSNDEEELDDSTTGTESDTSSLRWHLNEPSVRLTDMSFSEEIRSVCITKGNVLFDFLQVEHGRCVLLCSKDTVEGPYSVVLHNFRQSATVTHHILHKALKGRSRLSEQHGDKNWVSKALTPICEHGVLFNCDVVEPRDVHKRKPRLRQVSYWVVGRMYPNQRELYLCYQDSSVTQNLIEIAFKLAYYSM